MRYGVPVLAAIAVFGLLAQPSPVPAQVLPIVDLHFHPDEDWDLGALVSAFDSVGVARAGNGATGPDSLALSFAARFRDRFIPFAGQGPIGRFIRTDGQRAGRGETPELLSYLNQLEGQLREGRFKGLGEVFPNNLNSNPASLPGTRFPADSPLMQRLWQFSATYSIPLSVHMDVEGSSVAEMERLLTTDRKGTWIWAHCGFAHPPLVRRLLQTHANLHCELSLRQSVRLGPGGQEFAVDVGERLKPDWRALLEEFPDRFVLGTDTRSPQISEYVGLIRHWRQILSQLSDQTAPRVAHQNAERILRLPPVTR